MRWRTEERVFQGAHYIWLSGLSVFIVGGVFLDSWPVMGVGLLLVVVGMLIMGLLL